MKFFADECVYLATVHVLRAWEHDVRTAHEAGLDGQHSIKIYFKQALRGAGLSARRRWTYSPCPHPHPRALWIKQIPGREIILAGDLL